MAMPTGEGVFLQKQKCFVSMRVAWFTLLTQGPGSTFRNSQSTGSACCPTPKLQRVQKKKKKKSLLCYDS